MTEALSAPRGTRDIVGEEAIAFAEIEEAATALFAHYGYSEIIAPIFESAELFTQSVGDDTDIVKKEMYVFEDRKARKLALRPEGTAGVVRAYIERSLGEGPGGVTRLWYNGPMFRYERPQAGRYRQFVQLGCELFGSSSPAADIEVIDIATRLLHRLGVAVEARLNHLGCRNCKRDYAAELAGYLKGHMDALCPDCRDRLARNPLRVLDCKVETCRRITASAPRIRHCDSCQGEFAAVKKGLDRIGVPYRSDPTLVRGLGYYTGTVFEMISSELGAQDAVLGGGRYDELVESMGGKPTPAVGFAVGVDRLAQLICMRQDKAWASSPVPYIFVIAPSSPHGSPRTLSDSQLEAIWFVHALRRIFEKKSRTEGAAPEWIAHEVSGRSLKAGLKLADKLRASFVAIIGEDEAANGTVLLRHMANGRQEQIAVRGIDEEELANKLDEWCR